MVPLAGRRSVGCRPAQGAKQLCCRLRYRCEPLRLELGGFQGSARRRRAATLRAERTRPAQASWTSPCWRRPCTACSAIQSTSRAQVALKSASAGAHRCVTKRIGLFATRQRAAALAHAAARAQRDIAADSSHGLGRRVRGECCVSTLRATSCGSRLRIAAANTAVSP
jgi:hypothetical protein